MKQKSKGGKRKGAGRKPSENPTQPVNLYVKTSIIDAYGGKDGFKAFLYEAIDRHQSAYPDAFPKKKTIDHVTQPLRMGDVIKASGVLTTDMPVQNDPIVHKNPKDRLIPDKGLEHGRNSEEAILKQIAAIKAEKCPPERNTILGRRAWVMDQQKRIVELCQKLNRQE